MDQLQTSIDGNAVRREPALLSTPGSNPEQSGRQQVHSAGRIRGVFAQLTFFVSLSDVGGVQTFPVRALRSSMIGANTRLASDMPVLFFTRMPQYALDPREACLSNQAQSGER